MKHLNADAAKVFKAIIALMGEKDHIKLDNAPDTFMPLTVEFLYETSIGKVYSLTHWAGPYNGDLCRDPDCTFLLGADGISPMEFQQDLANYYVEASVVENGRLVVRDMRQYNELVAFCELWLRNIAEQQRLSV